MLLKKLTEILKTFDKAELKQFRRFISSDYFNTNESVIKLFKLIAALYPEFDITAQRASPEALFRKIYGSRKYDEKTYRYLLSTLYSLLEKYLAISLFERNDTEMKKYTIDDMTERRLFGLARKNLAVLESVLDKNNLIGGEYIYNKEDTNLIWHQLYFLSNIQEPILEKRYEWGEVQLFSSFVELSHVYQILHQVSQSYNIPLKENIVFEYLRNINYRKILEFIEVNENNGEAVAENGRLLKVLKIYLCFMITILDEKDEKYFNKMNDYVGMYSDMFGKNELQNLHLMLTTCCNRKRTSLNDEKYQLISSLVGAPQIPVVLAGSNTSQRYQTSDPVTFNLKFRIYSQQAIGPAAYLTGYKRALAMLSIYTPPIHSYDNKNTLQLLVGNVASTINEGLNTLAHITDYANQQFFEGVDASNTTVSKNFQSAKVEGMTLVNMMYDVYTADRNSRAEKTKLFTKELADAADKFNKMLEGDVIAQLHNDQTRVNSSLNTYNGIFGGAIWNLSIMPGMLKYSIPVSITNWTAALSKEIDSNGDAAYCDFTVACKTDQDKSALYWLNQIYSSDTDTYKLAFAKRNNKD